MKTITIIGSGMMGSALAFPARENGNRVRLVGTPLDREIIETCRKTGQHPKFEKPFPEGVEYYVHTHEGGKKEGRVFNKRADDNAPRDEIDRSQRRQKSRERICRDE